MKKYSGFIFLLIPMLIIAGCEEDVYAPLAKSSYPVVYCVLNKNDTAHYVRLTKTFSGPVDATVMAQNPDSLYYKNARVFAEMTGKTVEFKITNEVDREPGPFFSDYSILYKTTYRLCGAVRIHIVLPDEGTEIIGGTQLLDDPVFFAPDTTRLKVLGFYEPHSVMISWNGYEDACETNIRFKYLEISNSGIDTCWVDWIRKNYDFALLEDGLLRHLDAWIHDKPDVRYRKILGFDFLVSTGNGQMASYLKFKDWSIDYIDTPYSNLINAYGLVAARVNGGLFDYMPNQRFIDTLVNCKLTAHLKFVSW